MCIFLKISVTGKLYLPNPALTQFAVDTASIQIELPY